MSTQPKTFISPEQYLEIERKAEFKSEYYNGEMFPMDRAGLGTTDMAGAREAHGDIIWNLSGELRNQLREGPCRGHSNDMRVRVSATGLYTYPDIVIVCGERQYLDDRRDTLLNPTVIIEVLSRSTEAYDRGRKFEHYQSVTSLQHYVLVSSERMRVDLYTRQPDSTWILTAGNKPDESLALSAVGCTIKLSELYGGIEFDPNANAASR